MDIFEILIFFKSINTAYPSKYLHPIIHFFKNYHLNNLKIFIKFTMSSLVFYAISKAIFFFLFASCDSCIDLFQIFLTSGVNYW